MLTYDNELCFHINDEGLSITRNVCREITRASGKPISIELMKSPDYTFFIIKLMIMFMVSNGFRMTLLDQRTPLN